MADRPTISDPLHEHRRWFAAKLDQLRSLDHKLGSIISMPTNKKQELAERRLDVFAEIMDAFASGVEAEKKTVDLKLNEFRVDDRENSYFIELDDYADRSMADPPRYILTIWTLDEQKELNQVCVQLKGLQSYQFAIDSRVVRNINSEGP